MSTAASAQLTVNTGMGAAADEALQNTINSNFQVPNMTDFLARMANAQAIAHKGQGVSYATDHSLLVVGASGGVGLNSDSNFDFEAKGGLPKIGVGVQAAGMVGWSLASVPIPALGFLDPKRLTVFVSFMTYSNNSLIESLEVKTNSVGLHAQYKLIKGINVGKIGILNWGGIAFTTGINTSSNSLTFKVGQKIDTNLGAVTYTWTPDNNSKLTLEANSYSIPLELSTSVRLLYILSLFGGAGVDLNFGNATISANLNGPVTNSANSTTGSASLNLSQTANPSPVHLRFFAGTQFNLVPLRNTNLLSFYIQGNFALGGNYGVHAGVRAAW
ncbi:MAG: hypothetical protein N2Z22_07505 [Turneriella sp.]|nr:hypothetical protein [Turneriella sp.]